MGPEWDAPEAAAARERSRAALAPLAANRGPEAGPCGLEGRIVVAAAAAGGAAPAVRVRVRAPAGGEAVQLLCRDGQRRYATRLAGHSHPHLDFELRGVRFGRCKLLHAQLLLRAKALAPEEPVLLLSDAPLARDVALLADAAPPGKRAALVARLGLLLEQYDGLGWAVGAEPEAAGPRLDAFAQDAEGLLRMACLAGLPQLTSQLMSILEHLHLAYNAPAASPRGVVLAAAASASPAMLDVLASFKRTSDLWRGLDAKERGENGVTPFHVAVLGRGGEEATLRKLLGWEGFDTQLLSRLQTKDGLSPADYARMAGKPHLLRSLASP